MMNELVLIKLQSRAEREKRFVFVEKEVETAVVEEKKLFRMEIPEVVKQLAPALLGSFCPTRKCTSPTIFRPVKLLFSMMTFPFAVKKLILPKIKNKA